jgi:hypothetical protein
MVVLSTLVLLNEYVRPAVPTCALMLGTIPHFVAAVTWASLARALRLSENTTAAVVERFWSYYQRYVLFVFENIAGREVRRVQRAHTSRTVARVRRCERDAQ